MYFHAVWKELPVLPDCCAITSCLSALLAVNNAEASSHSKPQENMSTERGTGTIHSTLALAVADVAGQNVDIIEHLLWLDADRHQQLEVPLALDDLRSEQTPHIHSIEAERSEESEPLKNSHRIPACPRAARSNLEHTNGAFFAHAFDDPVQHTDWLAPELPDDLSPDEGHVGI